jgi:lipopolysaccharide export system permease protein
LILKDIIIYDHTSGEGNNKVLIAESGKMQLTPDEKFLELILYNGYSYIDLTKKNRKKENQFRTTSFKKDLIRFDLKTFHAMKNSEKLYKGHYAMLNNKQLSSAIDSLQLNYHEKKRLFKSNILSKYKKEIILDDNYKTSLVATKNKKEEYNIAINKIKALKSIAKSNKDELKYRKIIITKHKVEWHRKISLAVSCLLLFLIGAPLGSIIRKGGFGLPVLVSVIFFILYHVLNIIGEKAAKELTIQAYEGMWLSNFVFLPIAIFLIYKAKNDSVIFDFTRITLILNRFKKANTIA